MEKVPSRLLRAWAAFCSIALLAACVGLWYAVFAVPMDHRYTGPVCICPADNSGPPSGRATEERYH
jgi:hypothetical protein